VACSVLRMLALCGALEPIPAPAAAPGRALLKLDMVTMAAAVSGSEGIAVALSWFGTESLLTQVSLNLTWLRGVQSNQVPPFDKVRTA